MTCEIGNLLTNKKSKNKQRVLFICVQNVRKRERERERRQWAVYYTSPQSFTITFFYSLA